MWHFCRDKWCIGLIHAESTAPWDLCWCCDNFLFHAPSNQIQTQCPAGTVTGCAIWLILSVFYTDSSVCQSRYRYTVSVREDVMTLYCKCCFFFKKVPSVTPNTTGHLIKIFVVFCMSAGMCAFKDFIWQCFYTEIRTFQMRMHTALQTRWVMSNTSPVTSFYDCFGLV